MQTFLDNNRSNHSERELALIQNHCGGRLGARSGVDFDDAIWKRGLAEYWRNRLWYSLIAWTAAGSPGSATALPKMALLEKDDPRESLTKL